MKKITPLILLAICLVGCTSNSLDRTIAQVEQSAPVFHASFESTNSGTKTYVDESLHLFWNADDRLSIFAGNTYNHQYAFAGNDGDNSGDFTAIKAEGFHTGSNLSTNYSVYPYNPSNKISQTGEISLEFPAVQHFRWKSFGIGANTMLAVTENTDDYFLSFKNLCGYLVIKLYSQNNDVVKSISIFGNNGELIAGKAVASISFGQDPTSYMTDQATHSITLDCGSGVALGTSAETATEFWFAIPPTTFSKGFTITATNTEGKSMTKTTYPSKTITRNVVNSMTAINAEFDTEIGFVAFEDEGLKAYCVQEFDKNGDGEISFIEAKDITQIYYYEDCNSIKGLECFDNLSYLIIVSPTIDIIDLRSNKQLVSFHCNTDNVQEINLEGLDKLKSVNCYGTLVDNHGDPDKPQYTGYGKLESLNLKGCYSVIQLRCDSNPKLTNVDISDCPDLEEYIFYWCSYTSLDVSKNPKINYLYAAGNHISSIDISHNPNLEWISVYNNALTSIDLTHNPKIWFLWIGGNPFSEIIVPNSMESVKAMDCADIHVNDFDLSIFPNLDSLYIGDNPQMGQYDFSNNKKLHFLSIWREPTCIANLDLSNLSELRCLDLGENNIENWPDLSGNSKIERITIWNQGKEITNIDLSQLSFLRSLELHYCGLKSLDVSENTSLYKLECDGNQLTSLDISNNIKLQELKCTDNQISNIYVWEGFKASDYPYFFIDEFSVYQEKLQ